MRISEARIRRIIREEASRALLESSGGMSILPSDVPPELYAECFRRIYMNDPNWESKFSASNRDRLVRLGVESSLTQREAEELADLGIMCLGPGENYPFGLEEAPVMVIEALGISVTRGRKLISRLRQDLPGELGEGMSDQPFWTLSNGWAVTTSDRAGDYPGGLRPEIEKLRSIDRSTLENGIRLMDSLYDFTEKVVGASKSTKQKLIRMIGPDGSGLIQMLEIYSSL